MSLLASLGTGTPRPERPSPWEFFKDFPRILPYLRPHKRLAFLSVGMVGLSALMALLSPWPLALLIDTVLGNKPLPALVGFLDGLDRDTLLVIAVLSGLLVTGLEHGLAVADEDRKSTRLNSSHVAISYA